MNRNTRIRDRFAKQETAAKKSLAKRVDAYYSNPEKYEKERLARLAKLGDKVPPARLPEVSPELPFPDGKQAEPMGFAKAVKEVAIPTKVEKPYRRTVMAYRPSSV